MASKIDGSRYHYWKQRYISTGNLKAFDLMTRHYAADPDNCRSVEVSFPVGRRHRTYPEPVIFTPLSNGPNTYQVPSIDWLARQDHVHRNDGVCIKNRYGPRCVARQDKGLLTVNLLGGILNA